MILVTGATGTIGRSLVAELAARQAPFRALVRDATRGREALGSGVELVEGDLSQPETLDAALDGVDHAFLLSPFVPDQETLHANLIQAAQRRGGVHVVKLGAIGASEQSRFNAGRQFARTDRLLQESGLDWTLLHPHAFMQNVLGSAASIAADGVFYGCTKDGRTGAVDTRDIAAVAAVCLTEPGHAGEAYAITGPESLTNDEMAATLSRVLGREIRYVDIPSEDWKQALIGFGVPEALAEDLRVLYGEIFPAGYGDVVTTTVQDVTGSAPRSFEQFARDHAAAFGG